MTQEQQVKNTAVQTVYAYVNIKLNRSDIQLCDAIEIRELLDHYENLMIVTFFTEEQDDLYSNLENQLQEVVDKIVQKHFNLTKAERIINSYCLDFIYLNYN